MFHRDLFVPKTSFFLFGPRGTGKSTWIRKNVRAELSYDLLQTSESLRLNRDPSAFGKECSAAKGGAWIVVDEVQKAPMILDEVHRLIEERKQKFVLSGSSARKLKRGASNLLAGRAEVCHLFPLVSKEVGFTRSVDEALEHGMLPMAVTGNRPESFLRAYVETYLREEVQAEALVRQIGGFARFLEVAARMNGQVVNASGVARDAGVARQTVQDYFQILVDTLIGSWLPAWKLKKPAKQVAHPKFYLFDCGVARHLAGFGHLAVHPEERGALLETYVLHEIRAYLHYNDLHYPIFYWRTHQGTEVDFIIESRSGVLVLEVKASTRWSSWDNAGLVRFRDDHPELKIRTVGVYRGARALKEKEVTVQPCEEFLRSLWGGELVQ